MTIYKEINDIAAYVDELRAKGVKIIIAEKFGRIQARKGILGEVVFSWSTDANGTPLLEKKAQVSVDAETREVDWVVTKINAEGAPIIDRNGKKNEWIIDDKNFHKKYVEDANQGIYKPVGGLQKFIKLQEAITIIQWENTMSVDASGYINITNLDDIYIISGRDFKDTYKIVE